MVYYLAGSIFIKLLFIISNFSIIFSIYLTNLVWFIKLPILVIVIFLNIKFFSANNLIKAFYLSQKSILLTRDHKQIKVKYFKTAFAGNILVILYFIRGKKIFKVPVFRDAVTLEQFKKLQLLARFNMFLRDEFFRTNS